MKLWLVLAVVSGCRDQPDTPVIAEQPTNPPPIENYPDQLIRGVLASNDGPRLMIITSSGIQPDGRIEPKRGYVELIYRPAAPGRGCWFETWQATGPSQGIELDCIGAPLRGVRCTFPQVWKAAIAQGAPADRRAHISLGVLSFDWSFQIRDQDNVVFETVIRDDC